MCPFCLSTMGLVVAGVVSTGGLTAFAVKVSRKKKNAEQITPNQNQIRNKERNNSQDLLNDLRHAPEI